MKHGPLEDVLPSGDIPFATLVYQRVITCNYQLVLNCWWLLLRCLVVSSEASHDRCGFLGPRIIVYLFELFSLPQQYETK